MNPSIENDILAYLDEKAPLLFFKLSPEGDIISANRYAMDLTERSLVGDNISHIIVDFSGKFDLKDFLSDPPRERLIHVCCSSGLPQSFFFTFKKVADGILALGRLDTVELDNMRKEVLSLNQELNNLTRELHKKNAQLKRLNEEKNRFLGMAAHDLRKPIGLVISYSEFLMEEAEDSLNQEQMGFLNTILRSSNFMKRLVDDFLDVSAIEAGRFDLDPQPASVDAVLSQSLKINSLQAARKGVHLALDCSSGSSMVYMDAPKIEQVITNLVSNAIEHTDSGTQVLITLLVDHEALRFSVKDEGPGIPAEEMARLFKPFQKTSTRKTGGEKSTGLGMVISRKIIEAHGGEIRIDSVEGEGTTVYFKIPIERDSRE